MIPTVERLHQLFRIDGGILIRRIATCSTAPAEATAGSLNSEGYLHVQIQGKKYKVHRIIYAMTNGVWPMGEVDHINGILIDNRPENLRDASHRQNSQNQAKHRQGKRPGCYWDKRRQKWHAQAWFDGKLHWLGYHSTEASGLAAYSKFLAERGLQ